MTRVRLSEPVPRNLGGQRCDQAVATMFPEYSRSRLKAWILDGSLKLDGIACRPRQRVAGGELVSVDAELREEVRVRPQAVEFPVLAEAAAYVIVDKPAGLVVHPGAGHHDQTLQHGLLHRYPELAELPRAGIVHRLDKDTSGLLLIARTLPAHTRLTRELAGRRITREYLAICNGLPTAGGRIDAPIARHPTRRARMAVHPTGRAAVTHYRVVERYRAHTLLRLQLETGRTHQIRVHLAHIRHPLLGDPLYGGRPRLPPGADAALTDVLRGFRRQALHACRLVFEDPETAAAVEFRSALPDDFEALRRALGAQND